jgi:hypothetical protein
VGKRKREGAHTNTGNEEERCAAFSQAPPCNLYCPDFGTRISPRKTEECARTNQSECSFALLNVWGRSGKREG